MILPVEGRESGMEVRCADRIQGHAHQRIGPGVFARRPLDAYSSQESGSGEVYVSPQEGCRAPRAGPGTHTCSIPGYCAGRTSTCMKFPCVFTLPTSIAVPVCGTTTLAIGACGDQ